jgi:hypothetical protein
MRSARPIKKTISGIRKWLSVRMALAVLENVIGILPSFYAIDLRQHSRAAGSLSRMLFLSTNTADVESGLKMELILNLVWALLAAVIFNQWLRHAPCKGASRGTQFAALAMLALLLFPVISVTDDLIAAQNPAEPDCCQRRVHVTPSGHSTYPAVAALPPPVVADLSFGFLRFVAPGQVSAPFVANPAFAAIQNRPPPAA